MSGIIFTTYCCRIVQNEYHRELSRFTGTFARTWDVFIDTIGIPIWREKLWRGVGSHEAR